MQKTLLRLVVIGALYITGAASAQTSFTGTNLGPIPDGPTGCYSTPQTQFRDVQFNVTGMTGPLTAVSVATTLSPAHTWAGDLTLTLISPGGVVSYPVVGRIGATTAGGCGTTSDFAGPYTFQNGTTSIWTVAGTSPIPSGTYCPNNFGGAGATNPMPCTDMNAAFAGLTTAQINGTWTLRFSDGSGGDTGTVSAATLTLTGSGATPPIFGYAPAPGSTVTATGGTTVGSTGNLTITPSIATPGSGTGAPATTTLTCTAPTAPFAGFGQTVTAVGSGAISGGPLSGTCTLGAAAVTQTLTCTENRGGTNVTRTWTLNCPAGTLSPLTSTPTSGSTITLPPQVVGGPATTATVQFQNPNPSAVTVTCTAPAATQFTVSPLTINVPASGNASTTISYTSATPGSFTGTLTCTAGAQTFTFTLNGSTLLPVQQVDALGHLAKLLLLLGVLGVGLLAVRRH